MCKLARVLVVALLPMDAIAVCRRMEELLSLSADVCRLLSCVAGRMEEQHRCCSLGDVDSRAVVAAELKTLTDGALESFRLDYDEDDDELDIAELNFCPDVAEMAAMAAMALVAPKLMLQVQEDHVEVPIPLHHPKLMLQVQEDHIEDPIPLHPYVFVCEEADEIDIPLFRRNGHWAVGPDAAGDWTLIATGPPLEKNVLLGIDDHMPHEHNEIVTDASEINLKVSEPRTDVQEYGKNVTNPIQDHVHAAQGPDEINPKDFEHCVQRSRRTRTAPSLQPSDDRRVLTAVAKLALMCWPECRAARLYHEPG